jgi:hypothetical protein
MTQHDFLQGLRLAEKDWRFARDWVRLCVTSDCRDLPEGTLGIFDMMTGLGTYYRVITSAPNEDGGIQTGSFVVTNAICEENWHIDVNTLRETAIENTHFHAVFDDFAPQGGDDGTGTLELTVDCDINSYGAGVLMLPGKLNPLYRLQRPIYVLPITEDHVLVVPTIEHADAKKLRFVSNYMTDRIIESRLEVPLTRDLYIYDPFDSHPLRKVRFEDEAEKVED